MSILYDLELANIEGWVLGICQEIDNTKRNNVFSSLTFIYTHKNIEPN